MIEKKGKLFLHIFPGITCELYLHLRICLSCIQREDISRLSLCEIYFSSAQKSPLK